MRQGLVAGVVCLVCGVLLSGCMALLAGGAVGAGAVAYVGGELKDKLNASPEETRRAIGAAVTDLHLMELKADGDGLSGDYVLATAKDEKINIRYEKQSDRVTQISIRVGTFGDENLSRALLDQIKKNLWPEVPDAARGRSQR